MKFNTHLLFFFLKLYNTNNKVNLINKSFLIKCHYSNFKILLAVIKYQPGHQQMKIFFGILSPITQKIFKWVQIYHFLVKTAIWPTLSRLWVTFYSNQLVHPESISNLSVFGSQECFRSVKNG